MNQSVAPHPSRPLLPRGPGSLIPDAVNLVLAAMARTDVPESEVPGFVRNVHTALLDVAKDAVSADPVLRGMGYYGGRKTEAAEGPSTQDILRNVGIRYVEALRAARAQPVPANEAAQTAQVPTTPAAPASVTATIPVAASTAVSLPGRLRSPSPAPTPKPVARRTLKPVRAKPPKPAPVKVERPKLPANLKTIEDAVRMDAIVCLEDGKRVADLRGHLAELGMTPDQYRRKWNLPTEYPMHSPLQILRRGETYEVDFVTGRMRPVL